MPLLRTTPHLDAPDDFYEALIETHAGLDAAQSHALNARLVLLLANHIGSLDVLRQALRAARDTVDRPTRPAQPAPDEPTPTPTPPEPTP